MGVCGEFGTLQGICAEVDRMAAEERRGRDEFSFWFTSFVSFESFVCFVLLDIEGARGSRIYVPLSAKSGIPYASIAKCTP